MLRVLFNHETEPTWVLDEDGFLALIDRLTADKFAEAPQGPVMVEGVDELQRVKWRALYPDAAALVMLAREIRAGRAVTRRVRRTG